MATYSEIQRWVIAESGFQPKTCWIAYCQEIYQLERHVAPNQRGPARVHPCPPDRQPAIEAAFRHFGMLQ